MSHSMGEDIGPSRRASAGDAGGATHLGTMDNATPRQFPGAVLLIPG